MFISRGRGALETPGGLCFSRLIVGNKHCHHPEPSNILRTSVQYGGLNKVKGIRGSILQYLAFCVKQVRSHSDIFATPYRHRTSILDRAAEMAKGISYHFIYMIYLCSRSYIVQQDCIDSSIALWDISHLDCSLT